MAARSVLPRDSRVGGRVDSRATLAVQGSFLSGVVGPLSLFLLSLSLGILLSAPQNGK